MKERPILFSAPMVRAILEGRKTQTRRIVKTVNSLPDGRGYVCLKKPGSNTVLPLVDGQWQWKPAAGDNWQPYERIDEFCPYGKPGDRLWVRETWGLMPTQHEWEKWVVYQADRMAHRAGIADGEDVHYRPIDRLDEWTPRIWTGDDPKWKSPYHMPRWASRITLEVTDVRVERLKDITTEDAEEEGVGSGSAILGGYAVKLTEWAKKLGLGFLDSRARARFAILWESIHGPGSWDANPWVWVVEFERCQKPY